MKKTNANSSVFIEDHSSVSDLKSCAFFWEHLYVYESYIQDLVGAHNDSLNLAKSLLEQGVLKVVTTSDEKFKSNLFDKIYAGMNGDFMEYLHENADDISVSVNPLDNWENIIGESSKEEYQDKTLCQLMDSMHYKAIKEDVLEETMQDEALSLISKKLPDELKQCIDEIVETKYFQYQNLDSRIRYSFEWLNESVLIKNSVSSSILTSKYQLPYYSYKFSNFRENDARYYIEAVNESMRFIKRDSINDLSFEEILNIRKHHSWKKAMVHLSDICKNIKYTQNIDEYKREITNELIFEYQDSMDEYRVTEKDLAKDIAKNAALVGMSFIPVVGAPASAMCTGADCLKSYLEKKQKQKNLAFFLTDIRYNRY